MFKLFSLAIFLTLAACTTQPAYAAEKCLPLTEWSKMAAAHGGIVEKEPLPQVKVDAANKIYATLPPVAPAPKADKVFEVDFTDGSGLILFSLNGSVCH